MKIFKKQIYVLLYIITFSFFVNMVYAVEYQGCIAKVGGEFIHETYPNPYITVQWILETPDSWPSEVYLNVAGANDEYAASVAGLETGGRTINNEKIIRWSGVQENTPLRRDMQELQKFGKGSLKISGYYAEFLPEQKKTLVNNGTMYFENSSNIPVVYGDNNMACFKASKKIDLGVMFLRYYYKSRSPSTQGHDDVKGCCKKCNSSMCSMM